VCCVQLAIPTMVEQFLAPDVPQPIRTTDRVK
jgi:hypothetical protein